MGLELSGTPEGKPISNPAKASQETPERHLQGKVARLSRRAGDVVGASLLLVLSSPLLLVSAAVVLLGSGRPIFFGHTRLGRGGKAFKCLKLRTMRNGAEGHLEEDPELKERYIRNGFKLPLDEDPRITPVGRWLRRSYVDELPQLINVLRGDMSLVGPRPVVQEELAEFGDDAQELLSHRPGIFGAWTVGVPRAGAPRGRISPQPHSRKGCLDPGSLDRGGFEGTRGRGVMEES